MHTDEEKELGALFPAGLSNCSSITIERALFVSSTEMDRSVHTG